MAVNRNALCAGNCSEAFHMKGICKLDVHKAENGGSGLGEGVWYIFRLAKKESEVIQSCLTLCNPVDCGLWGSSVHGIFQARILEWVAISFSRGSFQPRDWTQVSHTVGRHFTVWATKEVQVSKTNDKRAKEGQVSETRHRVWLFATPWAIQSMGFPRQEYWSGLPLPSPGDFPDSGIEPRSPTL